MNDLDKETILNIEELCDYLHIGRSVCYQLLSSGKIKAFRIGKMWRIPKSSVLSYIQTTCSV